MWELVRDLEVAGGLLAELSDHSTRYWRLVEAIDRALDSFDDADPASAATARHQLKDVLDAPAHATAHQVSAVGHAHIDSAWLWPLRETRRKVARTVSNVLALMDEDPQFVYRSEEHTSELQSRGHLVCRLLLEKKKTSS